MNKFVIYTVIAILLGTVTMVVPLAMLEPDNPTLSNDDLISEGGSTATETSQRDNMLVEPEEPTFSSGEPEDQAPNDELNEFTLSDSESSDKSPEEPPEPIVETWDESDVASNLSSIGLILIPGFFIALGVFIVLKRYSF